MDLSTIDLTHLVWRSLSGEHLPLAQINRGARRYHPSVAPFGALERQNHQSIGDLAQIMKPGEEVCLIDQHVDSSDLFEIISCSEVVQMVYGSNVAPSVPASIDVRELIRTDLPSMEALIAAVFSGFFRSHTPDMGKYFGIFVDDQLAAMAGERLVVTDLREISSICTHSAHQGRGFGACLSGYLIERILDTGKRPFLHVGSNNMNARRLYAKLGFLEVHVVAVNFYRRRANRADVPGRDC